MNNITVGYALCGSFCTIAQSLEQLKALREADYKVIPIMSEIVYTTDNRFNNANELIKQITDITGEEIIHTIKAAEPIGPKKMFDALIIAPCTGNTLAKLANAITDSCVTMAAKAHLRNARPLILGIATNDALGASAINIGKLLNTKNIYFVPFGQDDAFKKNNSLICDFSLIESTLQSALKGEQLQPILLK